MDGASHRYTEAQIVDTQKKGLRGPISEVLKDHDLVANIRKRIDGNPDHDDSDQWLAYNLFGLLEGVLKNGRSEVAKATAQDQIAWIKDLKDQAWHGAMTPKDLFESLDPQSSLAQPLTAILFSRGVLFV